jgi:hypothetical protein
MVIEHLADLERAWSTAAALYPHAVTADMPCAAIAARQIVDGDRIAVTALGQGDNESDAAYCLRYVLTLLAEETDAA